MTAIVVPSKFPDVFADCLSSLNRFASEEDKILVRDGKDIAPPDGWLTIEGVKPFVYGRNVNLGIAQATGDVLLCNDDVRFTRPGTVAALQAILDQYPEIGVVSPRIDGMVGNYLQNDVTRPVEYTNTRLAFVCVLVRRSMIDKIGPLDERFTGYGWEDDDFCRRVLDAGYRLAVTADTVVTHGHGNLKCSASFRRMPTEVWGDNGALYKQKWSAPKMEPMKIAVITPTIASRAGLLEECKESVRRQTIKGVPVFHAILEDKEQAGDSATRNKIIDGLDSSWNWLAFLDDDDLFLPHHLETLVEHSANADIVHSSQASIGFKASWTTGPINPRAIQSGNNIPITVLMRRSMFEKAGKFQKGKAEDWSLWKRSLAQGARFVYTPSITWTYRKLPNHRERGFYE
jgi:hypothetical protein